MEATMSKIERRMFTTELKLETRENQSTPVIRGHAAVFNKMSDDMFGFRERIRPGAFAKTLTKNPDVRALFNHDPNNILGRTKSGTLKVSEDDKGLFYEIDPPDTTVARDLMESLKRGDVDQSSFGFYVITDEWHKENGQMVRELVELDLHNGDVSPVTYPAYPQTKAEARAAMWPEGLPDEVRELLEPKSTEEDRQIEELRSKVAEAEQRASEALAKVADLEKSNEVLRLSNEKLQREAKDAQDLAAAEENRHAELMQQTKGELEQSHTALTEASRVMGVIAVRDQLIAEMFGHIKTASTQATELVEHKRDGLSDAIAQVEGAIRSVKSVASDFGRRLLLRSLN
jgi:HK97 family phage prohead protease